MSGGNAEKNRPSTRDQGYVCSHCFEPVAHKRAECPCQASPLATASTELAEKGTPLVADSIIRGAKEAVDMAEGKPVSDINTEQVTDPAHYAKSYPQGIEVYQMIEVILEKLGGHLTPYDQWLFGNILKYRLRAGFKDDGNDGMQDLKKAMRCREMMTD